MDWLDKENLSTLMIWMISIAGVILVVSGLCVYIISKRKHYNMSNSSPASGADSSPDADRIVEKLRSKRYGDTND